jgi:ribosomal protein S18 acetylase RimI-like enzyme
MLPAGALVPAGAPIRRSVVATRTARNALSTVQVFQAQAVVETPVPHSTLLTPVVPRTRFGFLALDGAEPAGCCICGLHGSGDPSFGYVATLAVRRPWRRRGLGLALLHHSFREFHHRGMTQAALDADAESLTGAVRLYERAGMHIHKRREVYEKAV